jgi:4-hydroxy-tetrahydrodipicolinate synthase
MARVIKGFPDDLRLPLVPASAVSRKAVDAALEIAGLV